MYSDLGSCFLAAATYPTLPEHWPSANLTVREYTPVARPFSSRYSDVAGFSARGVGLAVKTDENAVNLFLAKSPVCKGLEGLADFGFEEEIGGGYQRVVSAADPNRIVWYEYGQPLWNPVTLPMGKVTLSVLRFSASPLLDRDSPIGFSDAGQIAGTSSAGQIWLDLRADHQTNARSIDMAPATFAWMAQRFVSNATRHAAIRDRGWRWHNDQLLRQSMARYSQALRGVLTAATKKGPV